MGTPLRVLLIEDSEDDALLVLRELRRGGYAPVWERVDTAPALAAALPSREWHIILCDYVMPQFSGPAALQQIRESGCDVPVIIVSGEISQDAAIAGMRGGARDFVMKDDLARLLPAVARELREAEARREQRRVEEALRAAEQRFTTVFRQSLDGKLVIDAENGVILDANESVRRILGYPPDTLVGQHFSVLQPPQADGPAAALMDRTRVHGPVFAATEFQRADGTLCPVDLTVTSVAWGERPALIANLRDATQRREAEEAVRRRLDIERLVSGISSRFVGLRSEDVDRGIAGALREVGEFTGASLGYAFVFEDGVAEYGWSAPEAAADLGHCAARAGRSAWWMAQLRQGEPVLVPQVAELPSEADEERAQLASCGVESAVAVPTTDGDALCGFLGFVSRRTRRLRHGDVVLLLRIVGEIFANALQRRRAEGALRESERRYRELVENLSEVVYALDAGGRITYVSPNVESIGGYRPDEVVGRPFTDFIHPDDLAPLLESYQRTVAGHLEPSEYRVMAKSGDVVWVRTFSRPIVRDGAVVGLQAVLMDITDRKQAEERQHLFALLVEQAPVGIVMTDAGGQVTSANPAALQILGSPSEEATKQFNVLTLPNLQEAGISDVFRRAIVEKSAAQVEAPYRSYWGKESVVRMQVVPLYGHQGDVRGTLSIIEDATEQARWASALRASEQRLRRVLDGLGPTVFVGLLSLDGHIVEVNQAWLAAARLRPEDLYGQILDQIPGLSHSAAEAGRVRAGIEQAARGTSWRGDIEVRPRFGGVVMVDLFLGPLYDEAGQIAYLVGSAVDITDRTRAEAELRRLNAELERRVAERTAQLEAANKELEAFTYSVSHDLRAPLRAVDGFVQALAEDCAAQLDTEGRGYVGRIRTAAARMGQLIDDLLSLSRVGHGDLDLTEVDLSRVARSIAAELHRVQPERRVTFTIAEDVTVRGDARLLRVALENLLGNAWKYTSKHPTAHIEFGVLAHGVWPMADGQNQDAGRGGGDRMPSAISDQRVFFVRDDGAGFDMRYADRLFKAFQRLHGGDFEGTGVGLATVARIIHRHGGRIWAEGAVEQGTTVFFTLPDAPAR